MPLFSIVIPLYNKQKDITKTLKSVFEQSFTDFEVVIINDGSTDNSEAEILKFNDCRLNYHKTENNGVSQARNFGISKTKGKIIAFLDADDLWYPDHLEKLSVLHELYPNAGIIATGYEFLHPHNYIEIPYFKGLPMDFKGIVDNIFFHSMRYRLLWTSALAIKKDVFSAIGGFDHNITLGAGEDTDMWVRVALHYPIAFHNTITATYNTGGSNRVSHSDTLRRRFSKLDKFKKEEKTNQPLKQFLDMYRCEYALKHKLAGDMETFNFYMEGVDKKNISLHVKLILMLPLHLLHVLYKAKQNLRTLNIRFTIFNR